MEKHKEICELLKRLDLIYIGMEVCFKALINSHRFNIALRNDFFSYPKSSHVIVAGELV